MKLKKVTAMTVAATAAASTAITPMMSIVANAEEKEAKSPKENLEDAKKAEKDAKAKEEKAKADFNNAKKEKEDAKQSIKDLEAELQNAKTEASEAFKNAPDKANAEYIDAKQSLETSLNNQKVAQANVDEVFLLMKEAEKQVQAELDAVKKAEEKVNAAKEEIDQKKEILNQTEKEYNEKKAAADKAQTELTELNNNKNVSEEQKKAAEEALNKATLEKENAEKKVADLTAEVENATKAYEEALKNQEGSEKLQAAEEARKVAQDTYDKAVAERDNAVQDVKETEAKIEQLKQELGQAQSEEDRTKKEADLAKLHVTYHEQLNYLNNEAQPRIDNAQKEYDAASQIYETAKAEKEESDRLVQVALDEKTQAEKDLNDLKNSITDSDKIIEEAKAEIEKNTAILKDLETSISAAMNEKANAENKLKTAEEAVKSAQTVVEQKQKAYDDLVAAQSGKADQIAKGSLGFFETVGAGEEVLRILRDGEANHNTIIGADNDATSLENMKQALSILEECNRIRKENGLGQLMVTDRLMAISQVQTNASANVIGHSQLYPVGENLAWGTNTPFSGWYTEEKERLDQIVSQNKKYAQMRENGSSDYEICESIYEDDQNLWLEIGHYQNIINPNTEYTGSATSKHSESWHVTHGQVFDFDMAATDNEDFFVEEYIQRFNQYYNDLMSTDTSKVDAALKALDDAKAKLDSAKNNVVIASKEVQDKNELVFSLEKQQKDTNTAIADAQKRIENANSSIEDKEKLIIEAQKKVDDANAKYDNAVMDATSKTDAMNSAFEDMDYKSILLMQAERAMQDAEASVKESEDKIHAAGLEIIQDETEAKNKYEIAFKKYTDAYNKSVELEFNLGETENSLPGKEEYVKVKNNEVQDTKVGKDKADKNYQDVLESLGKEVAEAGKIKTQKENELKDAEKALSKVNDTVSVKEEEVANLTAEVKRLEKEVAAKEKETLELNDSVAKAKDLYDKAKKDFDSVSVPLKELEDAKDRLAKAEKELEDCKNERAVKEEELENAKTAVKNSEEVLRAAEKALETVKDISYDQAYLAPIEDPAFVYLNEYVNKVKNLEKAVIDAHNRLELAEETYEKTEETYKIAKQEYIAAQAALAVAQQEYDDYIKELNENKPVITVGDKSHWKKGDSGLMFRSNVKHEDFIKVLINGVELDKNSYIASEGSTIITLKTEYLMTLEDGEYTITVVSKNGSATATFYVSRDKANNDSTVTVNTNKSDNPKTGDPVTGLGLYTGLMAASGLAIKKLKKKK